MSGFRADWLALRANADARARNIELMREAARRATAAANGGPVHIVDLGSGTGAMLRALAPLIDAPQIWTLSDIDGALLAEAERLFALDPPAGVELRVREADLLRDPLFESAPHLVTATALFDLASRQFIDDLAATLAASRTSLLASLTYDGRKTVTPPRDDDERMLDAFNDHQRGEKTFGAALGPDAAAYLGEAMRQAGANVITADSCWQLERTQGDGTLIDAMVDGWASAVAEREPPPVDVARWRSGHHSAKQMCVGHTDLYAVF